VVVAFLVEGMFKNFLRGTDRNIMKASTLLISLVFCLFGSLSHGGTEEAEKSFEMEEETVQIRDTEAERVAAQKEAKKQQQIEAARAAQLKSILAEKEKVSKRAKTDIANAEVSRKKSEKSIALENAEIAKLKTQIDTLKGQVASAEDKAKTAQQTEQTGREAIETSKKELANLNVRKRKADMANVIYSARISHLKAEYQRISQQHAQAQAATKQSEKQSYDNRASQDKLTRDISSVKTNQ
jgi:chromosome segregation ATPase